MYGPTIILNHALNLKHRKLYHKTNLIKCLRACAKRTGNWKQVKWNFKIRVKFIKQ